MFMTLSGAYSSFDNSYKQEKIDNIVVDKYATTTSVDSFYTSNETYNVTGLSGDALLESLAGLMQDEHTTYTTYDQIKTYTINTDTDPDNSDNIILLYTGQSVSGTWDGGTTWNREHVWPQSLSNGLYGTSGAGSDIHHIRPASQSYNSSRGNKPFADLDETASDVKEKGYGNYYNDTYWEPRDSVKGDIARILMYMYTHYSTEVSANTDFSKAGNLKITSIVYGGSNSDSSSWNLLMDWNELDPVDSFEQYRNEKCAQYTGTRNPYIDHPEFARMIWDSSYSGQGALLDDGSEDDGGEIESIQLSSSSMDLIVGSSKLLSVTYTPSNASNKYVTWQTSDANVATVTNGYVTGISEGNATIRATTDNGKEATCEVTVSSLSSGDEDEDTTNPTVKYTVESKNSVSSEGEAPSSSSAVYSQSYSTTHQITNGNNATLTLSGYQNVQITNVTLNMKSNKSQGSGTITIKAGTTSLYDSGEKTFQEISGAYSSTYTDVNITNLQEYVIKENEEVVIEINATINSLYIKSYSITYKIISESGSTDIPVTGVSLSATSLNMNVNETATISVTISPQDATYSEINWQSSDASVVKVENGVLTALKAGNATIKAIVNGIFAECEVIVTAPIITITSTTYYQMVTSSDELIEGDIYVIASYNNDYAMSTTQNKNNRGIVNINKTTDVYSYLYEDNTETSSIQELTLGINDGDYTFYTGTGYLTASGGTNKNYLTTSSSVDTTSKWEISIDSSGKASIITTDNSVSRNTIRYNSSSSIISCYASGQGDICLYRISDANKLIDEWLNMRNVSSNNFCDLLAANDASIISLINKYDNLDTFGQSIVQGCDDVTNSYGTCKIGDSIAFAKSYLAINGSSKVQYSNLMNKSNNEMVFLFIMMLMFATMGLYAYYAKKKYNCFKD